MLIKSVEQAVLGGGDGGLCEPIELPQGDSVPTLPTLSQTLCTPASRKTQGITVASTARCGRIQRSSQRAEGWSMTATDGPDVVIAKQLLDRAKQGGFTFLRSAPGVDGSLVGYRVSGTCVDMIHIEGFSRDCLAWRTRTSSLVVSRDALVQRTIEGSALDVLNDVLSLERP
jgi:hypothetical protein